MRRTTTGRITLKDDQLIVQPTTEGAFWAIGGVFICIGLTQLNFVSVDQLGASLTCAAPFILFGVLVLLRDFSKSRVVIFDRRERVLIVKEQPHLQPMKVTRYAFRDLETIKTEDAYGYDSYHWNVVVVPKQGEPILIQSYENLRSADYAADQIKAFLSTKPDKDKR